MVSCDAVGHGGRTQRGRSSPHGKCPPINTQLTRRLIRFYPADLGYNEYRYGHYMPVTGIDRGTVEEIWQGGNECFVNKVAIHQPPAHQPPAHQPPAHQPPARQPPAHQPPARQPPARQPPARQPPARQPPARQQPARQQPAQQQPAHQLPAGTPMPPRKTAQPQPQPMIQPGQDLSTRHKRRRLDTRSARLEGVLLAVG